MQTQHPWQRHPAELVSHALEHLHRPSDFDQNVGYLLLDVGVETILKTYLLLPEEVIGRKVPSFRVRQEAANSQSFKHVLRKAWEIAGDDLKHIDWKDVLHHHTIRNKLYHQGDGVVATTENTKAYATTAVDLLKRLLGVDLQPELEAPKVAAALDRQERESRAAQVANVRDAQMRIHQAISAIGSAARTAVEKIDIECLLPSWEKKVQDSFEAELQAWGECETGSTECPEPNWDELEDALDEVRRSWDELEDGSTELSNESQHRQRWAWESIWIEPVMQQRLIRVREELDLSESQVDILGYVDISIRMAKCNPEGDLFPWVDYDEQDRLTKFLERCEETIADLERIRAVIAKGVAELET